MTMRGAVQEDLASHDGVLEMVREAPFKEKVQRNVSPEEMARFGRKSDPMRQPGPEDRQSPFRNAGFLVREAAGDISRGDVVQLNLVVLME
jgi:hypothetical protein